MVVVVFAAAVDRAAPRRTIAVFRRYSVVKWHSNIHDLAIVSPTPANLLDAPCLRAR